MDAFLQYVPAAVVALVIGLATQWVIRKAKRDDVAITKAATEAKTRIAETQQAFDEKNRHIERLENELRREHEWRLECEDRNQRLQAIVVGQIELEATKFQIEAE